MGTGNGSFLFGLREEGGEGVDEEDGEEEGEEGKEGKEEEEEKEKRKEEEREEGKEDRRRGGGFQGPMVGVDYSAASVELARRVAGERGMGPRGEKGEVRFEEWDIMKEEPGEWCPFVDGGAGERGFDVVLDKGTFDAISLCEERDGRGRRVCEGYRDRVVGLVRKGGYLLVTSCNWTEGELRGWFEGKGEGGGELEFWGRVKYPSFMFGGRTGQSISSVCFKKMS